MAKVDLTAQRLRELLHYDEETGIFTNRVNRWSRGVAGRQVGNTMPQGYRRIGIDGRIYQAHRLAWLYVYGEWPKHCIDHINGNKADNRIENLRDVTVETNTQNLRRARADSGTGYMGVFHFKGKYISYIRCAGKRIYLGLFNDPEEGSRVYLEAKRKLHSGNTL
jgi:hypothetical protein